jgi:pantetheine-phosphate adenylyltransferase
MSHRDLSEDENWLLFVFLDLDLSILGAPQEEYIEYAKAIRQEYIHVDDETFRRERGAFLKRWLARGQEGLYLYYTTPMRELFEAAAARNLQFEQEKLCMGLM